MKKVDFIFEELLRNGKSRRKVLTFDIDDLKDWKQLLNYINAYDNEHDLSKYSEEKISNDPKVWLEILQGYKGDVFNEGVEVGDEPDDYYWKNGPEGTKYYFNLAK
jgi:hypothetical protein